MQVYKAVLRGSGEAVAVKVQRPGVEPIILRDLFIFRSLASWINGFTMQRLGCNAELILDEFGEKLLEELDYQQEARNIEVSRPVPCCWEQGFTLFGRSMRWGAGKK